MAVVTAITTAHILPKIKLSLTKSSYLAEVTQLIISTRNYVCLIQILTSYQVDWLVLKNHLKDRKKEI